MDKLKLIISENIWIIPNGLGRIQFDTYVSQCFSRPAPSLADSSYLVDQFSDYQCNRE